MSIKKTYIPAKPRSSKLVGTSMSGGVAGSVSSSSADPNAHSHSNKVVLDKLTDGDIDVLGKLSLDEDGNIKVDTTLWTTGGISALGLGEGGEPGTGGDFDRLDAWVDYNETKANWVLSALLGYDLHTRVNSLEAGGGGGGDIEIVVTGAGNAVTGVSLSGNTLTFAKGSSFSLSTHTHDTLYKPIGYVPSWGEITGKPTTFAPSAHTHTIANVTDLQDALNGKEPSFTKNTAFNKNFGKVEGTVAQGNDSRINNGQTAFGWGNHSSAGYALNSALTAHTGNTTAHLTSNERNNWNTAYTNNHTHNNKSNLDSINQNLSKASNVQFNDIALQGILDTNKSLIEFVDKFNDMFEIKNGAIQAKYSLYSLGELSAFTASSDGLTSIKLMGDLNANNFDINGVKNIDIKTLTGLANLSLTTQITVPTVSSTKVESNELKIGKFTLKEDTSGRLGFYVNNVQKSYIDTNGNYTKL